MPQAEPYLRAMFADDGEAWEVLRDRYDDDHGFITPRYGVTPTNIEMHALNYLAQEWDYAYDLHR